MRDYAAKHGLHFFYRMGESRYAINYRCTCNRWSSSLSKAPSADATAQRQFGAHMRKVAGADHQDEMVGT